MSWMARILAIDRRLIFVLVGLGTAIPLLWPVNLPITVTPRVEAAYQTIESLPAGAHVTGMTALPHRRLFRRLVSIRSGRA